MDDKGWFDPDDKVWRKPGAWFLPEYNAYHQLCLDTKTEAMTYTEWVETHALSLQSGLSGVIEQLQERVADLTAERDAALALLAEYDDPEDVYGPLPPETEAGLREWIANDDGELAPFGWVPGPYCGENRTTVGHEWWEAQHGA